MELEIVDCAVVDETWQAGSATLPPLAALTLERDQLETAAEAAAREAANLRATVAALETQSAERMTQLTAQIAELAAQRDALSAQLESAELLSADRACLLAEQSAIVETLTGGQVELAEIRSHLAARENEIEGMLQQETRRVNEIQNRLEDALRERQTLESRLRQQADALRVEAASREVERERLIGECERLDDELNKLRELVGYTAAERDQLTLQMGQEQQRLVGEMRDLRLQQSDLAEVHRERAQLQERLDQVQGELTVAQKQLAILQVEGDHHLHREMEQTNELRRLLEQAEFAKAELTEKLERQARDWHLERECLREQAERVSVQCGQLEEQLAHIRTVFDSLAAERDRIAGELAVAAQRSEQDTRSLTSERDALARQLADTEAQRRLYEEQVTEQVEQAAAREARLAEIDTRADLVDEWQRQATEANDRVAFLQEQLADVELRLDSATSDYQTELAAARQLTSEWENKAGELQVQLSAARLELAAAESRFEGNQSTWQAELAAAEARHAALQQEAIQTRGELSASLAQLAEVEAREAALLAAASAPAARLEAESEVGSWQARAEAVECERQQLEAQLDELSEKVRFERETWHTDRERLHQECRMLGQRLIQQQRELDAAQADLKELQQSSSPGAGGQTITMHQLAQLAGSNCDESDSATQESIAEERAAWEVNRQVLTSRIELLEQQLETQAANASQSIEDATLGAESVADLRPNAIAAELAEQLAQLQTEQSEEVARRQQAEAAATEAAAARAIAEQSLVEARAQLSEADELRRQLTDLQEQLAADRNAANDSGNRLAALESELSQRQAELEQLQQDLAAASESQNGQPGELQSALTQLEQELAERERDIERQAAELSHRLALADERLADAESLRAELNRERETLAQEQLLLARQSAELHHVTPSVSDSSADDSTNSALAALRSENLDESVSRDSVPLGNLAQQKPVWMQPAAPAPPADDDSIEDYMSRLLRRVRGDSPPPAIPYQFPVQTPSPRAALSANPEPSAVETISQESVADSTPYRPRATAPELSTDLKAMRELANSVCRTAIAKHQKRRGGREVLEQLIGVVLALVVSSFAAGVAVLFQSWLAGFAALAGFVAVAYWTLRMIVRTFQIMRLSSPRQRGGELKAAEQPAAEQVAEEALVQSRPDVGPDLTPAAADDPPSDDSELPSVHADNSKVDSVESPISSSSV